MILSERFSSLLVYKSFKPQSRSCPETASISCSSLILRGRLAVSIFRSFPAIFYSLHLITWPVRVLQVRTLIAPYCIVEMISKSFTALLILALMSSVNAAAIGRGRQSLPLCEKDIANLRFRICSPGLL